MSRYGPPGVSYTFGPGAMTPAIRAILFVNIGAFIITMFAQSADGTNPIIQLFGLTPRAFLGLFRGENIGKQLVKVADPQV